MAMTQGQIEYLLHLTDEKIAQLQQERENAIREIEEKIAKLEVKERTKTQILKKKEQIINRQIEVFGAALNKLQETKERLRNSLASVSVAC